MSTTSLNARLEEFKNHVDRGLSANEIAEAMDLKMYQVRNLHYQLMAREQRYVGITYSGGRGILKASATGISISSGRIRALRLDFIFQEGQELRLENQDGQLVISPLDTSVNTTAGNNNPNPELQNADGSI